MGSIFFKAFCLLFMIFLGYFLKKVGIFKKEDGAAVSRVILNITLPCALMMGFQNFEFEFRYLMMPFLCIVLGLVLIGVGYLISRNKSREDKIYYILNLSGYNVGNFILPFVSGVIGSSGVIAVCLFDIGNAIICLGLSVLVVSLMINSEEKMTVGQCIKSLFSKPTFDIYMIMLLLSMLRIELPDFIYGIAGSIAPANAPLAMIMIGIMLEFSFKKEHVRKVAEVCVIRLIGASILGYLFYRFAPFDEVIRRSVAIVAFAPVASAAPAFTAEFDGNTELAGFVNSVSIIISMIVIPVLLLVL